MTGCEHRETVASYVLGALPEDEHERFATHLATCDECQSSVAELQVAADALPLAAAQLVPPPELKDRIMGVVRSEAQLQGAAESRGDEPAAATAEPRRPWWRRPLVAIRPLPAAVAAAVLIALGVVGGLLLTGGEETRTVQGKVEIASAPNARASLQLSDDATKLSVRNMPPPPSGKVYQVWLKRPAQDPTPTTALFRVDSRGSADVEVQRGKLKGVEAVLVTAEPDGGSMKPTSNPVIAVSTA
jgi:anti-sigma-K factor RskA